MDPKKKLKNSLNRLHNMGSNTPYDAVYKTLSEVADDVERLAKEVASELVQKIVDALKAKDTKPTPATETPTEPTKTEEIKDDQPK